MGCGSTYSGTYRYAYGPTYVPSNERTRVELPQSHHEGPEIDLSNLKKSALQSRIVGSRLNPESARIPSSRTEQADLFRSTNHLTESVVNNQGPPNGQLQYSGRSSQAPSIIPVPQQHPARFPQEMHGLSNIQRVESRGMPELEYAVSRQTIPEPARPAYQNLPPQNPPGASQFVASQLGYGAPMPYPPPQVQMISTLRPAGPPVQGMPGVVAPQLSHGAVPPGYTQALERDTQIMRADGSRVNIHQTTLQGTRNNVPPVHIPSMKLEPMGDEQAHSSKMMSFDYRKVEKPSVA